MCQRSLGHGARGRRRTSEEEELKEKRRSCLE